MPIYQVREVYDAFNFIVSILTLLTPFFPRKRTVAQRSFSVKLCHFVSVWFGVTDLNLKAVNLMMMMVMV